MDLFGYYVGQEPPVTWEQVYKEFRARQEQEEAEKEDAEARLHKSIINDMGHDL